jgi:hypothetical protein
VNERGALHRRDLPGAEHAGDRNVDPAAQRSGVMAGDAEQVSGSRKGYSKAARVWIVAEQSSARMPTGMNFLI